MIIPFLHLFSFLLLFASENLFLSGPRAFKADQSKFDTENS